MSLRGRPFRTEIRRWLPADDGALWSLRPSSSRALGTAHRELQPARTRCSPHGGRTPADYLKKRALADVTRATVVLERAHRHQLIADPGYDAFLTAWTTENARRRQAVAAHQVIYGPAQYTEANYFTYVLHDLHARLEQVLTQAGTIPAPESALRAYYRSHLATFRQQDATTHQLTTPRFGQVVQQVRQAYVHSRYQAMTADLAGTARLSIDKAVLASVPVD